MMIPAVVLLPLLLVISTVPALAQTPPESFESKYCSGCHAIDKKMVGPAMKEIAAKHRDRADALDYLLSKIKKGGVGVWGQVPMPPNDTLPDGEARALAEWILKIK